jgi:hypothetical protein
MISEFIERRLAEVDDLAELKVTLIALRLLEQKASPASVTERELLAQPAIRDGLSFPAISMRPALQRALARGTLLAAQIGDEAPRYFANDPAGRHAVDMLYEAIEPKEETGARIGAVMVEIVREIERWEQVDVYSVSHDDTALIETWLACGYSQDEIKTAIQLTLRAPRPRHLPARSVKDIGSALTAAPPAAPSEYFEVMVARTKRMPDEVINLRERLGRQPTPKEYVTVRNAVGLFGLTATLDCLKRMWSEGGEKAINVESLLPLLAEQEASSLALQRKSVDRGMQLRDVIQLYERTLGVLITPYIASEIEAMLSDFPSMSVWRTAFEHAAAVNKTRWEYIKKLVTNPSPALFLPAPVNGTASFAFENYRRRIGNGILPASVATEINELVVALPDEKAWESAFVAAESANVLRWNYIRQILRRSLEAPTKKNHGRAKSTTKRGGTFRRSQVQYTEAERAAAEERARQQLARRSAQPAQPAQSGDTSHSNRSE